jgi:hypothetical protein
MVCSNTEFSAQEILTIVFYEIAYSKEFFISNAIISLGFIQCTKCDRSWEWEAIIDALSRTFPS